MNDLARAPGAEDRMSTRNFTRLSAFVTQMSGIKMPSNKTTMLSGRLRRRLRATGHATLGDYCAWLFDGDGLAVEAEHLLNAVTTNKTDFFREPGHFDFLTRTLLPVVAAERRPRLRLWSAGCSTGAEPYTLAMLLDAYMQDHAGPAFDILATDIDTDVLATARRGIFPRAAVEPVPPALRQRYVLQATAPHRDEVRIVPALRQAISFGQLNLMEAHYPVGGMMDLIFCRNVLIYFDRRTQEQVVRRLLDTLRPGGHLFLGHSESLTDLDLPLDFVGNTIFRKR